MVSAPPVQVTYCATEPIRHRSNNARYTAGLRVIVSFRNLATVAATQIRFELSSEDDHKALLRFTDKGVFSPNVTINRHRFEASLLSDPVVRPVCTVLGVTFADGGSWQPPQ